MHTLATSPIRLGIAGLGRAFSLMLPTFLGDPRIVLAAACDPRESARRQFAQDFDAPVYAGIEALAADPAVDAIYIASPHQFHAEHTRIAAAAGKHVLVEKPMALSLAECDQMIEACDAAGVYLIVGHCHSFDSPYLETRRIIESGTLGAVKMISATNYTDFLFRPRRPEELMTDQGGGVVFSQAAHQVDVVRLLAGSRATHLRCMLGNWDPARPTEGAYAALLWFEDGIFASLTYSGYAHFDSDEWCGWTGEMGAPKSAADYGLARRRLGQLACGADEAQLKAAATYGGAAYKAPERAARQGRDQHQHFGPVIVSCERGDLRPLPDGVAIYGDLERSHRPLALPAVPRFEVIDELYRALADAIAPVHDGRWAKATLEICLAMLDSGKQQRDIPLFHQTGLRRQREPGNLGS
jgi:phthalate 4,5-cis-dihydrodiol dehydrogenase